MNVSPNVVVGYKEMNISYSLLSKEQGLKNLAILLPGAGYTVQGPLLHYSTRMFLNRSFDVLQINYKYTDTFYREFSTEELSLAIQHDVGTVIEKVLKDAPYENFYLIGKSLGTIALSSEMKRDIFKYAKVVWLTPLLQRDDVFEAMLASQNKGFCIIGDTDPCYIEERYNQLKNNSNLVLKLIPDVNHGLEYDNNAIESIDVLKSVMKEIEQF